MRLSYKFRLFTNTAQEAALAAMLGAFCELYNAGLQQRIEAYQRRGVSLRYGNQAGELKAVRAADERLAGLPLMRLALVRVPREVSTWVQSTASARASF